jgi:PKD repeat protein
MKTPYFTKNIRRSLLTLVLITAGLFMAGNAQASCKAGFLDTIHGKQVSFYNTSTAANSSYKLKWSFGDGGTSDTKTSITHTYADYNKTYKVCLYLYDSIANCRDTLCTTVTTGKAPCAASFSYVVGKTAGSIVFTNTSTSATGSYKCSWDFGDGSSLSTSTSPSHTYSASGSYKVCLTITDSASSCKNQYCTTINVCAIVSSFTYSQSNYKLSFSSTSTTSAHTRYLWYFGDGTRDSTSGAKASHTYTTGTSAKVYLIIYDSTTKCSAYSFQTITFCSISATFTNSVSGLTLAGSVPTSNGATVKYKWDFGDKATSTSKGITHTYSASGTYNVCLTATDSVTGCNITYCQNITVSGCNLSVSYSYSVSGRTVTFGGGSNGSTHTKLTWIFGDGTRDSTSGKSVKHTYSGTTSSYVVYLLAYDSATKCSAYYKTTIVLCIASSKFTDKISGFAAQFTSDSTNGKTIKYKWDFGDKSATSADKSPKHTYSANGTYTVCLTATDSVTGCYSTTCQNITINNCTLTASFTYTNSGRKVSFSGKTNASSHSKVIWFFGDNAVDSSNTLKPTHTYSGTATSYNVYMRVYDSTTKCLYYATLKISFCHLSAHFTYAVSGKGVKLVPDSTNPSTTKYYWSFGDKTTSKDKSPAHTYSAAGTYYVCCYASDSPCTASYCDSIKISTSTATYCIHGTVSCGKVTGYPCIVYLITFNSKDSSLSAVDSVTIKDTTGKYEFCGLKNGIYYTKAALLKSHKYYKYFVPTYHVDATRWSGAQKIVLYNANVTGADIKMKTGTNPGGAGFVGGKIKAGANKTGDAVANVLVIIYDANDNPVTYTYSDANGYYSFSGLAFGTYTVEGEIVGKVCYPALVTLTDSNASYNDVDLNVNTSTVTASIKPVEHWTVEKTAVYPNPVSEKLNISTDLSSAQQVNIRIFDVTGKVVTEINTSIGGGQQNTILDATGLAKGVYFMKMQLQKDNKILEARFIKVQ